MTRLCPRCLIVVAEWLGLWKPVVPKQPREKQKVIRCLPDFALDVLQAMVDLADQRYGERIDLPTSDFSTESAIQFVQGYVRMVEKEAQVRRVSPMFTNCG